MLIESPANELSDPTPPAVRRLPGLWLVGAARCRSPRTRTTRVTKLTDTQCVLLSTAAKRDNLSIYRCCQSNANRSLQDAPRVRRAGG